MLGNEIEMHKQLTEVRKQLDKNLAAKVALKSVYSCGSKVSMPNLPGVALVKNNLTADFVGVTHCKSPWCCPVCTARAMAKYASDIAIAIDALKAKNQYAAMITFTIPHTSGFSCLQSTEILYKVWKAFTIHGNKPAGNFKNDVFANFAAEHNHKHRVRVAEYTWGNHGWHPHFHALFWFPKDKFNDIVEWEERLQNRWIELCKRYTERELLLSYPEAERKNYKKQVKKRVEIMYKSFEGGSDCVHISKTDKGLPIIQQSSMYLCGWGADREITGNFEEKATAKGHFTWQQILSNAIANSPADEEDEQLNETMPEEARKLNKWWKLYLEYAMATRKNRHARVNFSVHSGLKKIIAEWKRTEQYKETIKKNLQSREKKFGKWKTVCWFLKKDWYEICAKRLQPDILELAMLPNAVELIAELLAENHIGKPIDHPMWSAALDEALNKAA